MILITSAKYCPPEFLIEFGKLPPSFLPLGTKRLYEYQAALFKHFKENIFLSLPKSFEPSKADRKKLKNLGIKTLFVDENLSLGQSIIHCLNMSLPINESLKILHGDTLISNLGKSPNSLGVTRVLNNYNWSFLKKDKKLCYKLKDFDYKELDSLILNGFFSIEKPYEFMRALSVANYDFLEGLNAYSAGNAFELSFDEFWLDFGLVSSYFQSKKAMTTQRIFNELKIKQNWVEKSSKLKNKIEAEISWFEALPKELSFYVPKIQKDEKSYKSEYLYLNTLSELFVFGRLPALVWEQIFKSIKAFLEKLHSYKTKQKINFSYKQKSLERLELFAKQSGFDLEKSLKFEEKGELYALPNLRQILNELDDFLSGNLKPCFIHGDFCFSNLMFDFRSNELKCFDPRGLDFSGKITPFGDKNYDYAKLTHSVLGRYDFIIAGFYELSQKDGVFSLSFEEDENLKAIQAKFKEIFKSSKEILAIEVHLFLSMLPLHSDNKTRQFALLANALRLFKELKCL
ncbi:capsular biosynthesis protein [Campylobacter sp. MIT 99-7217]|uniref:phosphotransferase n=1 Tax=Campylobacter sp. MIT 99-7217 TaxID=535091 RepID=UPI00115A1879|nr:phosphotransferase [Campylobacter sp. MIT 99-7217]TQR34592.1 capsular biosynthesis protein [Campylobacter sp. MIT 99-7217]